MNYQWYPGHMTKAKRMMQENIKLIDLIIELVDARAPLASRNPDIDELGKGKSRIVLLNKADLAEVSVNRQWMNYFEAGGCHVLEVNSRTGAGVKGINHVVQLACAEKIARDRRRGIVNRPVRAMVVGIPNVGKSTFINAFAGKACTKTGNKPGVTKGKQWIRLNKTLELLDTPGILWPKFEDSQVGMRLAFIGSINDEIIIMEELACDLLNCLRAVCPDAVTARYGIEWRENAADMLTEIARSRGCFLKGEALDLKKAADMLTDDFRAGRLGRISLERPPAQQTGKRASESEG
ncbi:MAG: ribosome biogenesis GTPase YlqF [Lachnospiraceae bacterium]|nr:ribosome biogenesis GTPase YlqF [Lachnospiraceae bacterium]